MKHFRHPLNKGRLKNASKTFKGVNYSCGDQLSIFVILDKQKRIKKVAWEGAGCAVSQAGASIFSEMIKGKTLNQVKKMNSEELVKKLNVKLSPIRRKCATLPLFTIKDAEKIITKK
ncbi:iron-sulfur cluster assembly scaffold protein [Patescibacteria group bacterium]|nr:iron-sulfur cluster assembly scaffold protein [Patescibacteria group bacterium]